MSCPPEEKPAPAFCKAIEARPAREVEGGFVLDTVVHHCPRMGRPGCPLHSLFARPLAISPDVPLRYSTWRPT